MLLQHLDLQNQLFYFQIYLEKQKVTNWDIICITHLNHSLTYAYFLDESFGY